METSEILKKTLTHECTKKPMRKTQISPYNVESVPLAIAQGRRRRLTVRELKEEV